MATTAIWKIKGNLGQVVNYAANPDKTVFSPAELQGLRDVMNYTTQDYKTEEQRYVSGVNCIPEIARDEMMMVKRQFGKEGGVIAFHGYQSFAPGEVTPEQAHRIGVELARKLWGDRFQVIIATHLDKKHIHNHFVLNSVSFVDGKKYNDCKATYALMRRTSDELCREHGLSVIENPEQGRSMSYDAWEAEKKGMPTWHSQIRQDVDSCIARSFLFADFLDNLKRQGYAVKTGKYIAVRPPGKERFVRLKTLGGSYSEEAIRERIRQHEQTPLYHRPSPPRKQRKTLCGRIQKMAGFRALYYRYVYLLRKWRNPKAPPRKRRYNMAEIIKFDRYVEQAGLLTRYRIDTEGQLRTLKEALENEIDILAGQRNGLYRQKRKVPESEEISSQIVLVNQLIKGYRHELRVCDRIEADIPTVQQAVHEQTRLPKKREGHLKRRSIHPHQR